MQVHSVECQLAQAQMNLYLAGESLDEEAVVALERHVSTCESCKATLQAKKRSLQSLLQTAVGAEGFSEPHLPELRIERPAKAVADVATEDVPAALRPQTAVGAPKLKNWKPIAYSVALAAVLVAMSLLGDPTKWLGGSVAEKKGVAATESHKSDKAEGPVASEEEAKKELTQPEPAIEAANGAIVAAKEVGDDPMADIDPAPISETPERVVAGYTAKLAAQDPQQDSPAEVETPPADPPKPAIAKKSKTKPIHRKPSKLVRRATKPKLRPRVVAKAKAKGGGIKVYDQHGQPIH